MRTFWWPFKKLFWTGETHFGLWDFSKIGPSKIQNYSGFQYFFWKSGSLPSLGRKRSVRLLGSLSSLGQKWSVRERALRAPKWSVGEPLTFHPGFWTIASGEYHNFSVTSFFLLKTRIWKPAYNNFVSVPVYAPGTVINPLSVPLNSIAIPAKILLVV